MNTDKRFENVINWFRTNQPVAETELSYKSPYQLIVAVVLSAQCTDKRVNIVTAELFKKYPSAQSLAEADIPDIFEMIKSVSYPNNKSKHLSGMAKMLVNEFNGEVPDNIDDLQKLPGVGRKTANVIVSVVFKKPAMAVDTHVFRVAERVGLAINSKTPLETEKQLVKGIPEQYLPVAHHWLILHGRYVCTARKPKCDKCGIKNYCKYYSINNKSHEQGNI
ncbi:MAG: endonuclease III [Prevotellaceae bacterium]|jgi:endonuclease-3|nr:endonuclease III [Prevotellaceae bacterium]